MLTETKINRNVKKKKKKLPLRKSSKGSDVPGQGEGKPARLADPTPRGGRVFPSVGPREAVPG